MSSNRRVPFSWSGPAAKERASLRAERLRARRRYRLDPNFANITASLFEWQSKYVQGGGNVSTQAVNSTQPSTGWMSWLAMGSSTWQSATTLVDGECELIKAREPKKEYLVLVAVGDTATPVRCADRWRGEGAQRRAGNPIGRAFARPHVLGPSNHARAQDGLVRMDPREDVARRACQRHACVGACWK